MRCTFYPLGRHKPREVPLILHILKYSYVLIVLFSCLHVLFIDGEKGWKVAYILLQYYPYTRLTCIHNVAEMYPHFQRSGAVVMMTDSWNDRNADFVRRDGGEFLVIPARLTEPRKKFNSTVMYPLRVAESLSNAKADREKSEREVCWCDPPRIVPGPTPPHH